jgi:hypothetical protein
MNGEKFWCRCYDVGKPTGQHFCDARVEFYASASEQRLIRHIPEKHMCELIFSIGRDAALVNQFCFNRPSLGSGGVSSSEGVTI